MNRFARLLAASALVVLGSGVAGHGAEAGDVAIVHPFATPTVPGATTGAAYFALIENKGTRPDRLLRASTPAAARVELHSMRVDAQGIMRMREIDVLALAPGARVAMRPGQGAHLMLVGLREPLREGATFPMTLEFERGGKVEVKVVVQVPKPRDGAPHAHLH